ncbi:transporter [Roseiarcaceae bacterium H3SJ34-1]|uniref:transporter n=1 Tax=Terripilifer ovatus TaxID=3032367 RepID=UPI003AB97433|nr:transporter [Roseiarcaceae bacterium H3SJ34-1]
MTTQADGELAPGAGDRRGDIDLSAASKSGNYGIVPGLVWAFHIHNDGSAEPMPVEQALENRHDGWLWVHLNLTDARARQWLKDIDLPVAAMKLLTSHDNHQQLHATDACIYGVIADLSQSLGETVDEFAHLHFVATERLLISGRYRALAAVNKVRELIQQDEYRLPSVAALMELIVENVADAVARLADKISADLDKLEDDLTRGSYEDSRLHLSRARRTSVTLHRHLAGLRTLFHRLELEGTADLKPQLRLAASKLAQRLDALDHDVVEIRDRARLLQEEISEALAAASNRAVNILSVITTVVLPPTLVSGIFGMNTKGLPFAEDPDGFLWATALMIAATVGVYFLMKRIGALKF